MAETDRNTNRLRNVIQVLARVEKQTQECAANFIEVPSTFNLNDAREGEINFLVLLFLGGGGYQVQLNFNLHVTQFCKEKKFASNGNCQIP